MIKSISLSLLLSTVLLSKTFIYTLPFSSRSVENGGILSAIDAYQDGV